jgi:Fe2+ or Zn2+ uptake regulation protein
MQSIETLIELFRKNGMKATPQRRAIFELLAQSESHLTAEEIFQQLLPAMPSISRTTVYNTIRELVRLGEVTLVEELSDNGALYDTNTHDHHHLSCLECHALVDVDQDFEGLVLAPAEDHGYEIIKSHVTFYGYCPACQEARRQREASGE